MWRLARSNLAAHRGSLTGTVVVLALAAALLSASGVLVESGVRAETGPTGPGAADGGALTALASSFIGTTVLVVVLVVAATVTLAMRPRRRDLALLRAVGATSRQVRRMVTAELLLLTVVVAPLGALPGLWAARLATPLLVDAGMVPDDFTLTLSPLPALGAVALLVPVAVGAAHLAVRETLRSSPTSALGSTLVEPAGLGRVRRVLALVTAVTGVVVAGTPLVVPGAVGGAGAATSGLLLVGAAALAGPALVAWTFGLSARDHVGARPVRHLARANTRGFSRRLSAVVVPLAAVVAVGTIQTSTGDAVQEAAGQQLRDGLHADLVVTAADGLSADQVARIEADPAVDEATPLSSLTVRVRTDEEEIGALEGLSWETGPMRVLPAGGAAAYDPGLVDGSLDALEDPDTVAVSTDARLLNGAGLGESVTVRLGDGETTELRVVAVYDRSLGFGDYTLGAATLADRGLEQPADTVLVTSSRPDVLADRLATSGHQVSTVADYIEAATATSAGEQRLSAALLLALLGFLLVGAANALVMLTAGRRPEWLLLGRIGATRRQLLRLATLESLVTASAAVAIGTLSVVPALLGVSFGLLGAQVPAVDLTTYAALVAVVVLVSLASTVPTVAARLGRSRVPA
ncbi:FtsX-like permease family protein [Nocardioides ferulae]|uniref:FtsX-like permease family protein n=1 Tax=Nocardioides ferulae TaxID=2340821 RepID=UPI000EAE31F5|nr:ABC transporter permease [Nocardioides ferulae]